MAKTVPEERRFKSLCVGIGKTRLRTHWRYKTMKLHQLNKQMRFTMFLKQSEGIDQRSERMILGCCMNKGYRSVERPSAAGDIGCPESMDSRAAEEREANFRKGWKLLESSWKKEAAENNG